VAENENREEQEPVSVEDATEQSSDLDWDENEPSPHQGEEGQEVSR
jgi:hypothetical protein